MRRKYDDSKSWTGCIRCLMFDVSMVGCVDWMTSWREGSVAMEVVGTGLDGLPGAPQNMRCCVREWKLARGPLLQASLVATPDPNLKTPCRFFLRPYRFTPYACATFVCRRPRSLNVTAQLQWRPSLPPTPTARVAQPATFTSNL